MFNIWKKIGREWEGAKQICRAKGNVRGEEKIPCYVAESSLNYKVLDFIDLFNKFICCPSHPWRDSGSYV